MLDLDAISSRAQHTYATVNPGNLGRYGAQVLTEDIPAVIAEVRRLRNVVTQMQQAIDYRGDNPDCILPESALTHAKDE